MIEKSTINTATIVTNLVMLIIIKIDSILKI